MTMAFPGDTPSIEAAKRNTSGSGLERVICVPSAIASKKSSRPSFSESAGYSYWMIQQPEIATLTQCMESHSHIFEKIAWSHGKNVTLVDIILLLCKRQLFLVGIVVALFSQNDFQAYSSADAPQSLVDLFIERNPQAVSHSFLCKIMILVRAANHAIQIKDNCVYIIHFSNSNPFLVNTGSFPSPPAAMVCPPWYSVPSKKSFQTPSGR